MNYNLVIGRYTVKKIVTIYKMLYINYTYVEVDQSLYLLKNL